MHAMRPTFLPFSRPAIGEEEIAEVVDSLRSGWITTGPKVERFARAFAEYTGGRHALPVSSATAGLHLALLAHGVGPGDEVIVPAMTFASTANVVVHTGAVPVLADVHAGNLQIQPEDIERRLTRRTRAVIPVHFAGQPADLDPILALAAQAKAAVIEDAAHAVGTEYRGRRIGSLPTTSVFSFHPNKNITTGEGGMVVTGDDAVADQVALLRFHGMDRNAWKRFDKSGSHRYDIGAAGFKYNMMDLQAAIGLHQLPRLDGFIAERTRQAAVYDKALGEMPGLVPPSRVPWPHRHAWHLYTPLLDLDRLSIDRDRFISELKARNIGAGLHYTAVHEFSYYARRFGFRPEDFPGAHHVSERILSLPLFPGLGETDQQDVLEAIVDIVKRHGR
jgi:dTDP-4-amino-4,6-dideoxygalactose transaminase